MARYPSTFKSYKSHYACFDCRKSFKAAYGGEISGSNLENLVWDETRVCPTCSQEAYRMGRDFAAPKKNNATAWKILEILVREGGVRFESSSCPWAQSQPMPTSIHDAHKLARARREYQNQYGHLPVRIFPPDFAL